MGKNWQSPIDGSLDRLTFTEKGRLDEICGSRVAHLEHMSGNNWFLLIGHDDGTETAVWFSSKDLRHPFIERRESRTETAQKQPERTETDMNKAGANAD